MPFTLVAAALSLAILWPVDATAANCCHQTMPCCEQPAPCCTAQPAEASAIAMLLALDPQLNPAPPVVQTAEVFFKQPTFIGKTIVQGHYIIEHDNDRMARGEPCTHVYAFDDRTTPVATFHCTHLERDTRPGTAVVVLVDDLWGFKRLKEFQFAGEHAAHGYPTAR